MQFDSHRGSVVRGNRRNLQTFKTPGISSARLACAAAVALTLASAIAAQAQQQSTVPVGTVYAEKRPIAQTRDFVGRVEATDRVEVRARVKGYLDEVLFKEGDKVKKGDPLYRIEKGLFEADVEQAKGNLERTKSAKVLTAIQLQRAQDLLDKNAGTVVARDQALAADQQAEGAIMSDQANLDTSNINLGYTDITSPINGKVSKTNVTVGNVVGPDSGVLTTIVSQDPMYVVVSGQPARIAASAAARKLRPTPMASRSRSVLPTARPTNRKARSISSTCRSIAPPTRCSSAPRCPIRTAF